MSRYFFSPAPAALLALVVSVSSAAAQATAAAEQDHAGYMAMPGHDQTPPAESGAQDHGAHPASVDEQQYPAGVPPLTDEDRAAAFPRLENGGHAVHDNAVHAYVLFDRLEWQVGEGITAGSWNSRGWIGRDIDRLWFRTEGEAGGDVQAAQAHVLYGRAIHRWWDLVAGVRQDFGSGKARTWAAVGVQGLAPYWFEVQATAYVGESGRTHFRVETEYDLLLTNRWILQPLVELDIYGKSDPGRGIGGGLSSGELGLRVRYEFRRELAPYIGVAWNRKLFGTAELAKAAGESMGGARFATGLRVWF